MVYPHNFEEKLGFDKIISKVRAYARCPLGVSRIEAMTFMTDRQQLTLQLQLLQEMMTLSSQASTPLPTEYYFDLTAPLKRLRVVGTYLESEELLHFLQSQRTIAALARYFASDNAHGGGISLTSDTGVVTTVDPQHAFPHLTAQATDVVTYPDLLCRIDQVLTPTGELRDNASPALAEIRRELQRTLGSIGHLLNNILRQAQAEGYIEADVTPTMRDGRLVLPVPPSSKRKVRGIVHDESATGKTLFIEPAEVVEANNRIRELEGEERQEIIRILTELAALIRPEVDNLLAGYDFLGEIDFLLAKVQLARDIDGIVPSLSPDNITDWVQARHPLLYMRYQKEGKQVVPLDILLDHEAHRIVLISGPNAGGKSVCLETLGLVQYMCQHALPVPMKDNSSMAIYDNIFIDIGDQQSIDSDLSTYSSHLENMKFFLRHAKKLFPTLLLIDEFGSGTEPQIGGAIAQALLAKFNEEEVNGVVTTHYTNLKLFASNTHGIVNGAMLYDRANLRPLFQLEVGQPGSSFALEIAHKIGLPPAVIEEAKHIVGSDYVNMDKYLQDISRDKRYWEQKRQKIHQQERALEEKIQATETLQKETKERKHQILQAARDEASSLLQEANSRIEKTIRDIKQAQADREATRAIRQEHERFIKEVTTDKESPASKGKTASTPVATEKPDEIAPHDRVRLKGQGVAGEVLAVSGRSVRIAFGSLVSTVDLSRVEKVSRNALRQQQAQTQTAANALAESLKAAHSGGRTGQMVDFMSERRAAFHTQLDVRGMRADEALQTVMYYLDDATLLAVPEVRILHGTGTGALREAIRLYLDSLPQVKTFHDEQVQLGGAGITVVTMR